MNSKARVIRVFRLMRTHQKQTFMMLSSFSEKLAVASAAVALFPEEFGFRPFLAMVVSLISISAMFFFAYDADEEE